MNVIEIRQMVGMLKEGRETKPNRVKFSGFPKGHYQDLYVTR